METLTDIRNQARGHDERCAVEAEKADHYQVRLHWERYRFAKRFVRDKIVLDMACGTGYGSHFLLVEGGARRVVGVDVEPEAVEHARGRYKHPDLEYQIGDAQAIDLPDNSFDAVVSFETIEHLPDYVAYLREVRRVLRPGGVFLFSTPNRLRESPGCGPDEPVPNPHHVREFTRAELLPQIQRHFRVDSVQGQGLLHPLFAPLPVVKQWRKFQTLLRKARLARLPIGHIGMRGVRPWTGLASNPAYFLMVCSKTGTDNEFKRNDDK